MRFRWLLSLALVSVGSACGDHMLPTELRGTEQRALARQQASDGYIVVLRPGSEDVGVAAQRLANQSAGEVRRIFRSVLRGFSARMSPEAADRLRQNPAVAMVVENGPVGGAHDFGTRSSPVWGLDRIDQRNLPRNNNYHYWGNGYGVRVYIVDSGIRTTHSEFNGRASVGFNAHNDGYGTTDCTGHGTHVAGTVGGATYGVANGVQLISIRVLNCSNSGNWSDVIAGLDWVAANHVKPAVANLSLAGGGNAAADSAVANLVAAGVTVVVAAGNGTTPTNGSDACYISPAREPLAITVAASRKNDTHPGWSNWGACIDLHAPGDSVKSAWHTSNSATNIELGTSMAAPHVAGVVARFLELNPTATTTQVHDTIVNSATPNKISGYYHSPNRLLYWQDPFHTSSVMLNSQVASGGGNLLNWTFNHDAYGYDVNLVIVSVPPPFGPEVS